MTVSYQNWYVGQTYPAWDIPLARDATTTGTSSTAVSAPGSQAITVSANFLTNVTTSTTIIVDLGTSQQETVTPTAVSASTNQFTATFAKTHSGTYTLVVFYEDITSVNIANFSMTFRNSQGVDTLGTGIFSVKTTAPAEIYYKPSQADVAQPFNGTLIIKANFPPSNSTADEVVYDGISFTITAS